MANGRVQMPTDVHSGVAPGSRPQRTRLITLRVLALVLLLGLPFAEVGTLAFVAGRIGVWPTVGVVLTTSALGLLLLVFQGLRSWRALVDALRTGRMPSRELADTTLVLMGGTLLFLPGLLTDVVGLILLLPFTRVLTLRLLGGLLTHHVARVHRESGIIPGEADPGPDSTDDAVVVGRLLR